MEAKSLKHRPQPAGAAAAGRASRPEPLRVRDYPLFNDPEGYLRLRDPGRVRGFFKRWSERRAIDRCLRGRRDVRTVCDVPCGPGRLFHYWQAKGFTVLGIDLSPQMVEAARETQRCLALPGRVSLSDVFDLPKQALEPADMVACVRFCYYFDRPRRLELLRALAAVSRRYVLVQYKTSQTYKGRRNFARAAHGNGKGHGAKYSCTDREIRDELSEAALSCLAISPIGPSSDRVFVLAEKSPQTG